MAHLLRANGLRPGDHLAILMENQIRFMEIVWAALRSGLHLTAINSFLTAEEVEYIIDDCDARLVVSSRAKGEVAGAIDPAATPQVEQWLMTERVVGGGAGPAWESYEDAMAAHPAHPIEGQVPGMVDVAVFGVPDPEMGEQVKAVVQPVDGTGGPELAADLIAFARDHIAHYKCPRSVDFLAELPRLPTGKLYKRLLRDRYWGTAGSTIA